MKFHHFLLLGACLAVAVSCKDKPVEPEEEAPKVEWTGPTTQALFDRGCSFDAGAGSVPICFKANNPWNITVAESKSVSWIVVEPESGPAGDAVVNVGVESNSSTEPRSATLTLNCGEFHQQLTITQEGKDDTPPTPPDPIPVERVILSPESLELLVGETAEITYSIYPENAEYGGIVVITSSDMLVARVEAGTVTALSPGTSVITAEAGGVKGYCTVTVEAPFVAVESVTVSMTELTLLEGTDYLLTAKVLPENATDPSVTWTSSDETVATVEEGLVKALKEGTAVITAKAGEKESQCALTVAKDFVPVSSITLNLSEAKLLPGETAVLNATVLPEDATDPSVTWSSSDESVATVSDGTVTAVAPGEAVITARAGEQEARCTVTVETPYVPVTSITVSPTQITLTEGDETNLTATVLPEDATDPHVAFSSSEPGVATVDDGGKVTAVKAGKAIITASAGDCKAECSVTVEARIVPVESVSLSVSSLTLDVGESADLMAKVLPENATDPSVTWSSSNETVASVNGGHVEALQAGNAVITARAGNVEASCKVTVNQPFVAVESITLDKTELSLAKGGTATLKATVLPGNATDPSVTWKSNRTSVVSVDNQGNLTAKKVGQAIITATAGEYSATCTVTVTTPATGISLNYESYTIRPNETVQLKVIVKPTGATMGEVSWNSSYETVASVDDNGLVTGVSNGVAVITATMDGLEATCIILVSSTASGGHEGTGTEEWE